MTEKFRHSNVQLQAGETIIPCGQKSEEVRVVLARFPDHGTPAFVGSTIKSRKVIIEAADKLSEAESQRLNNTWRTAMDGLLKNKILTSQGVFKSSIIGKPDIHVLVNGDTYKDNSLRLYCHIGEYAGAIVLWQDARTTKKDSARVENALIKEGGYRPPKNWGLKSGNNKD